MITKIVKLNSKINGVVSASSAFLIKINLTARIAENVSVSSQLTTSIYGKSMLVEKEVYR